MSFCRIPNIEYTVVDRARNTYQINCTRTQLDSNGRKGKKTVSLLFSAPKDSSTQIQDIPEQSKKRAQS